MKSVKNTAVSSILAALLACPLLACTADVAPTDPEGEVTHAARTGAPAPGAGNVGNERSPTVGTTSHRAGSISPWDEPLPNPWDQGDEGHTLPDHISLPDIQTGAIDIPTPRPNTHHPVRDPDQEERYDGHGRLPF